MIRSLLPLNVQLMLGLWPVTLPVMAFIGLKRSGKWWHLLGFIVIFLAGVLGMSTTDLTWFGRFFLWIFGIFFMKPIFEDTAIPERTYVIGYALFFLWGGMWSEKALPLLLQALRLIL